ncbi:MAG: hypothetical protein SOV76_05455 [Treponema succinifaciens]|uniref:hypothetical protein n=1 Tax=Treponema succinifaciens TaxID=167 RepID=UPI002A765FAD|nr:hypothetical protein [Treponema succinifaciens]MDY2615991.1 hypothetical protein [Treponema succinifaciens]
MNYSTENQSSIRKKERSAASAKSVVLCVTRTIPFAIAVAAICVSQYGAVPKVWGSPNYFKFTREFKSAKI